MVDARLMRGESWVRCCICGELHTAPFGNLFSEFDKELGRIVRFDVCNGECAREAGLAPKARKSFPGDDTICDPR